MTGNHALSREQVRAIDRIAIEEFGIAGIVLMENAGRGCADLLINKGVCTSSPVVICCGKGNNGGDGFVMARHLEVQGVPVEVVIFGSPTEFSGDAGTNYQIASRTDIPIHQLNLPDDLPQFEKHLAHASWVVDALLGTGATGPVRPPYSDAIRAMNQSGRPIMAIDVPSGLDCDLGDSVECCIQATVTATLIAPKPGFASEAGEQATGEVVTLEIGVPQSILTSIGDNQGISENL